MPSNQSSAPLLQISSLLMAVAVMTVGCGRQTEGFPELGQVEGRITLDGLSLADATVTFEPEKGRPSSGKTDEFGQFTLMYLDDVPGAVVGTHTVRISTASVVVDMEAGTEEFIPETVPADYNTDSMLTAEVFLGENDISLDLKTPGR